MTTVYLTLAFVALFFILMSVRLIFLKNGQFKGTCASQNPYQTIPLKSNMKEMAKFK